MRPRSTPSSSSRAAHFSSSVRSAHTERDVVEADAELAEVAGRRRRAVLVEADQGAAADQVHRVVQVGVGVLVDHGLGVEERLVPRDAHGEVAHGQRDVGERGELGHVVPSLLVRVGHCAACSSVRVSRTERP